MADDISEFREYIKKRQWPPNRVAIECAWLSQQRPGTCKRIMLATEKVEEWKRARRERKTES